MMPSDSTSITSFSTACCHPLNAGPVRAFTPRPESQNTAAPSASAVRMRTPRIGDDTEREVETISLFMLLSWGARDKTFTSFLLVERGHEFLARQVQPRPDRAHGNAERRGDLRVREALDG